MRPLGTGLVMPVMLIVAACSRAQPARAPDAAQPISTVRYLCQQNKTIVADFFDGSSRVASDGRPVPGGRVTLSLSDGRRYDLPQTIAASGTRYANPSGSFVFWSKGDTAFVQEGAAQTYAGCVAQQG